MIEFYPVLSSGPYKANSAFSSSSVRPNHLQRLFGDGRGISCSGLKGGWFGHDHGETVLDQTELGNGAYVQNGAFLVFVVLGLLGFLIAFSVLFCFAPVLLGVFLVGFFVCLFVLVCF